MRNAVEEAIKEMTGRYPDVCFSGWDGKLTAEERAVLDDSLPTYVDIPFGEALKLAKHGGALIARKGWNGKGMHVRYIDLYNDAKYSVTEHEPTDGILLPWLGMKTADNKFVPWLASQTDILAEDWCVVDWSVVERPSPT